MFNPLTAAEVVTAIGRAARHAARDDDPGGDFERDQLLSAYSATRHLAGEMAGYAEAFERFCDAVAQRLSAEAGTGAAQPLEQAVAALRDERTPMAVGAALADLLAGLRDSSDPAAAELRADVHGLLRELAEREVSILADAVA